MARDEAWFQRQLEHCRAALAEADRIHTEEEREAAAAALAAPSNAPQGVLFTAAPNTGVMTGGQPEPAGLAAAPSSQASRRTA